jgi:hypothetical protein
MLEGDGGGGQAAASTARRAHAGSPRAQRESNTDASARAAQEQHRRASPLRLPLGLHRATCSAVLARAWQSAPAQTCYR